MKRINDCSENGYDFTFKRQEEGKRFVLKSDKKFNCQVVDIDKCVFEYYEILIVHACLNIEEPWII